MYTVNKNRIIKTFTDLAKISSPSWQEHKVIEYLVNKLNKLHIPYKKYKCKDSFNLLISFPGNKKKTPILFSAHMDTVTPCDGVKPIVTDTKITSDGTTILGSDDKSALAIFLESLQIIKEKNMDHGDIELLLTCAEEVGLQGIQLFDLNLLKSKYAFVFDCNGRVGNIIIKAPFHSRLDITIKGKAAHAGMEPEKGINAIVVLSQIIADLPNGRIDDETTMNIGTIEGGNATNVVAENASCSLEVRSIDKKKLLEYEKKVTASIKKITTSHKAKYTINRILLYSGFTIKENEKLLNLTINALTRIKINPNMKISGGGSDTNIINGAGIKAVNLSCGMMNVHSTKEYIMIKDLINGAKLMLSIIESV